MKQNPPIGVTGPRNRGPPNARPTAERVLVRSNGCSVMACIGAGGRQHTIDAAREQKHAGNPSVNGAIRCGLWQGKQRHRVQQVVEYRSFVRIGGASRRQCRLCHGACRAHGERFAKSSVGLRRTSATKKGTLQGENGLTTGHLRRVKGLPSPSVRRTPPSPHQSRQAAQPSYPCSCCR